MNDQQDAGAFAKAKICALYFLKYRPRSQQEIIRRLQREGFSDSVIQETVGYFKKTGAVNDRQFALLWVQSRLKKPFGIRRIQRELQEKGIHEDTISDVLRQTADDYSEEAAVMSEAARRMGQYTGLDRPTARRRLYHYMARRGFDNRTIITVIKKITDTDE